MALDKRIARRLWSTQEMPPPPKHDYVDPTNQTLPLRLLSICAVYPSTRVGWVRVEKPCRYFSSLIAVPSFTVNSSRPRWLVVGLEDREA